MIISVAIVRAGLNVDSCFGGSCLGGSLLVVDSWQVSMLVLFLLIISDSGSLISPLSEDNVWL